MKIAVTGVGGGVGQSILKGLSLSELPLHVYPVDVQPFSAGLFRGSGGTVLPKPEQPESLARWEQWLLAEGIDALIPGSDRDLQALASVRDDWAARNVCRVLVSDLSLVNTCRDKAETSRRLESEGLPFARSIWDTNVADAADWCAETGYPVVLKPRDGFASRNVHLLADEEELRFFFPRTPNPLLQEHLGDVSGSDEFTCSVFVDSGGVPIGTFMARRDLAGGATYRAEVGVWPEIHDLLLRIGARLKPMGPLNVQLRRTPRGPVPFELNVRCSGTSGIRAYFGFNEPDMLVRHFVGNEPLRRVTPRCGYAFRYWNEMFLEDADADRIRQGPSGLHAEVLAWP